MATPAITAHSHTFTLSQRTHARPQIHRHTHTHTPHTRTHEHHRADEYRGKGCPILTVTSQKTTPASGDKHDYMSLAYYGHPCNNSPCGEGPNCDMETGLPWVCVAHIDHAYVRVRVLSRHGCCLFVARVYECVRTHSHDCTRVHLHVDIAHRSF